MHKHWFFLTAYPSDSDLSYIVDSVDSILLAGSLGEEGAGSREARMISLCFIAPLLLFLFI